MADPSFVKLVRTTVCAAVLNLYINVRASVGSADPDSIGLTQLPCAAGGAAAGHQQCERLHPADR